jgi:pimeloyl-ACP methyl ester carboxylesterase
MVKKNPVADFLLPADFRRPPLVRMLQEGRFVGEASRHAVRGIAASRTRTPYAGSHPARDADPVLLVPGFMAGDYTLAPLARTLRGQGYRTYRAGIMLANKSCTLDTAEMLEARLEAIVARREQRVQVVGHSLGGMLARGIAARRPDLVSGIVTMGSPVLAPGAHHRALGVFVLGLVSLSKVGVANVMNETCVGGECALESFQEAQAPLPTDVAYTAIWSRNDGIVDYRACLDPAATHVEVRASHIGMAVDPRVSDRVLDALASHRQAAAAGAHLRVATA